MLFSLMLLLQVLLLLSVVEAFVPPKPGTDLAATYEPVHLYRRRLNITFEYTPKALHPETCRYLTVQECQDADESMQRHQQRHRDLQAMLHDDRRRLLDSSSASLRGGASQEQEELRYHKAEFERLLAQATQYFSEHWQQPTRDEELQELQELLEWDQQRQQHTTASPGHRQLPNPRVGQFRVLILLMRFSDHANRQVPNKYEYQILWNLRIRKWLIQNSYGKYDAFFEVRNWKKTDNTEAHYSFGQSGRVAAFQESYFPLLEALDSDPNWDWSPYDVDGDGKLDNLIVIHSGYAAEEGGQDCTNGREYLDRIWSHAFSDSNGWKNSAGTIEVEGYMIASGLDLTCDSAVAKMGVMTHEYLHTFYLIDLYDYTFEGKGIGSFDIMAYPYGFSNDGYIPVSLSTWAKIAIDWLTCDEKSSGTVNLEPIVSSTKGCVRIPLQNGDTPGLAEYLLLENRQQLGFDVNFWQSGVVIYHVDEAANEQYDRGYPGQSGWPGNGNHYKIAVLPADQNYDLEQGNNNGDAGDMWTAGTSIGPGGGGVFPNTDMYQGGKIQKSGITIDIQEQNGSKFKIKITNSKKSGPDDDASLTSIFSAPSREPPQQQSTTAEYAQAQFRTPDAEEFRMSGKVPQLPWFDELVQAGGIETLDQSQQGEDSTIEVLDSLVDSSSGYRLQSDYLYSLGIMAAMTLGSIAF